MRIVIAISIIAAAFAASFVIRGWLEEPHPEASAPPVGDCTRVVCLSPGLTETMFALGLGDLVVGVTRYCLYPPEATERPNIGGFLDPNYEAVVALRPGMALATPYQKELAADLQRLGVVVHAISQDSLADIRDSYQHVAELCGAHEQAAALTETLDETVARITREQRDKPRPRVLMTTGRDVGSGTLDEVYAVGHGTFLDELLTRAGGENIAPGGVLEYPALSAEGILRLDPDIIIELVADREYDAALEERALSAWQTLPNLRAARERRIYALFGSYLTIPGPRVARTLEALARCLSASADGNP